MASDPDLSRQERIRARHVLQEVSEYAKTLRDALDPNHGVPWAHRENFVADIDVMVKKLAELKSGRVITTGGDT